MVKRGVTIGLISGLIFAVVQMLSAGMMAETGLMPLRLFSSVVMGERGLTTNSVGLSVLIGVIVHVLLSAGYGVAYAAIDERLSPDFRQSWSRHALLGIAFGAVLYLVNIQIIARIVYPWFLMVPQGVQMLMHVFFFGLPLGMMFAAYARRFHRTLVPRTV